MSASWNGGDCLIMEKITWCVNDSRLVLRIPEDLTSANADGIYREIRETADSVKHEALELDLSSVNYVSSAGLRVFLTLNREENGLAVSGLQPSVYGTFEITGLDRLFTISRAMREVSLKQAELIGKGFFSLVYRLDEENIIKVFVRDSSEADIRRELELDKYAMISGVPTAISYDVVKTEDGNKGVVYEMMDCGTLRDAFRDMSDQREELLDLYAKMIKTLHATADTEKRLPDARQQVMTSLEARGGILTSEEMRSIRGLLETIPESDRMIHGDCHVKNIMMHHGEPLLIDLDTLSRGDPVIELGNLFYTYIAFEELWPGNNVEFLGLENSVLQSIFEGLLKRYAPAADPETWEENLRKIRVVGYLRFLVYLADFHGEDKEAIRLTKERLLREASRCSDLRLVLS